MKPEAFIKNYEKALVTQNWQNVAPLIHENANVIFSNGAIHIGKEHIKKAFEHNFSIIKNEKYAIKNVRWILKKETTAMYAFEFFWKGIINEKSVEGEGIGTCVLIKEQDLWILLSEHLGKK